MARAAKDKKPTGLKSVAARLERRPGRRIVVAFVLALVGLVALQASRAAIVVEPDPAFTAETLASEQIVVRLKEGVLSAQTAATFQAAGASEIDSMENLRMKVLKVPPAARDAVIERLKADSRFEFVVADEVVKDMVTRPSDARYNGQWAWHVTLTDLMWDFTKGSSSVVVAAVDSGISYDHPELQGKIVTGYDFVNNDNDPTDDSGHGTNVAGVIAANSNNSVGVAGGCWNRKVMPIKVTANGSGLTSNWAKGYEYAVDHGAKIINASHSSNATTPTPVITTAVNYAASKGALVIAAAGNTGLSETRYPAAEPNAIAVAATDPDDKLTSYSTYGSHVDIAAPGSVDTTAFPGTGYAVVNGTSFAAPVVSGIAALLWSAFPNATALQIRDAMIKNADTCCAGRISGGRINAIKAYNALAGTAPVDTAKPAVSILSPAAGTTASGTSMPITVDTDKADVVKAHLLVDGKIFPVNTAHPHWWTFDTTVLSDGAHTYTAVAYDAAGNAGTATRSFTINNAKPADTVKPAVSITSPSEGGAISGTSVPVEYTVQDNVAVAVVRVWVDDGSTINDIVPPFRVSLNTTSRPDGEHTINAQAVDSSGNATTVSKKVIYKNTTTTPSDTVKPALTVEEPAEGANMTGTAAPIRATATDNVGVASVRFLVGSGTPFDDTTAPYAAVINTTGLTGTRVITVTAFDAAGNSTAVTRNVTLNATTPPPPPPTKPADLNGDDKINISDLSTLLSNWGKTGANLIGDINKSGKVDIADLSALLSAWTV